MIKISHYIEYLSKEVVDACKKADLYSIHNAKQYAKDDYLKYFEAPRFVIPKMKLDIPLKITDMDTEIAYDFVIDEELFIQELNDSIQQLSQNRKVALKKVRPTHLQDGELKEIIEALTELTEVKMKDVEDIVNHIRTMYILQELDTSEISISAEEKMNINVIFNANLKEVIVKRLKPKSVNLNEIYINPDTTALKKIDNKELLLNLELEFVEERIKVVTARDEQGNKFEEVIFS